MEPHREQSLFPMQPIVPDYGFQVVFIHTILFCQYVLESGVMFISLDQTDVQNQRDL
ncbi:MAG: hypothetical protein Q4B00_05870 [Eubacteriales bacterium]|nr:hypothetical protein [Eubacteriales bacterium]